MKIEFTSIGNIKTPYEKEAPFRPDPDAGGDFIIVVKPEYEEALYKLAAFSHIIVLFHFDRSLQSRLRAHPPHLQGLEVGLFASRSPRRINKIGVDIVKILKINKNMIHTSPMDILNNTPLLDIKPYIPDLDCFPGASSGHAPDHGVFNDQ
ncbi:MAG: tRNA (N6-threonylcarbamoyladenosine(37)-N6)-methyltransferase TrmO [Bacteroidetes bacterium]|nr:tRNA (N6-threonylcarbamoyladenosine(37)-N6)-methyltransferase TrmO [Bacteroidota bacterium]